MDSEYEKEKEFAERRRNTLAGQCEEARAAGEELWRLCLKEWPLSTLRRWIIRVLEMITDAR